MTKKEPSEPKSLGEILKEQLVLVSFLVLYAGLVATDSYYSTLSVGYQFLSLPASHLLYRGITTVIEAPALLLVYVIAVAFLVIDDQLSRSAVRYVQWRAVAGYLLVVVLLAMTFPLARRGGIRAAEHDLWDATSTLPRVHITTTGGEDLQAEQRWRLVFQSAGRIAVVKALRPADVVLNGRVMIRYFPESAITTMETEPREIRPVAVTAFQLPSRAR
jgi:hypothetical protein